ncbi:O-antigen ligase family protein [Galactobacillus timonensis]|uniref:O-antigen ligase family protein n=1 Tax=Galactobacillus timonensis TaxID=2041840 RepID=UPI000C834F3E|nr:O-antigen ligase family protein [Galactobacillus timonensis]
MFKEKVKKYLTDYRYIISVQILGMLILRDLIQDVFYLFSGIQSTVWNAFSAFVSLFALCIFLYEAVHRKLLTSPIQNTLWVFFAITFVGTAMRREGLWIKSWIYEFLLFMKIYLFFILIPRLGKGETDKFLYRISKWCIAVFCTINTVSLLILILHLLGFPDLPGVFAYSSMVTTSNHDGQYQFYGLYEWMTDGSYRTVTALVLGLFLYSRRQLKPALYYLNLVTAVSYLLLAKARSGLLCLIPIALYGIFFVLQKWKNRKFAKTVLLSLLVLGAIAIAIKTGPKLYTLRVLRTTDVYAFESQMNSITNGRFMMWEAGIQVGMEKPVFGWGWAYLPAKLVEMTFNDAGISLHNILVNVFVFSGFAGLISLLVFFFASIVRFWRNRHLIASTKSGWLLILVLCGWIQSMLQPGILGENSHIESIYFWIAYGYLIYLDYGTDSVSKAAVQA